MCTGQVYEENRNGAAFLPARALRIEVAQGTKPRQTRQLPRPSHEVRPTRRTELCGVWSWLRTYRKHRDCSEAETRACSVKPQSCDAKPWGRRGRGGGQRLKPRHDGRSINNPPSQPHPQSRDPSARSSTHQAHPSAKTNRTTIRPWFATLLPNKA